MSADRLPLLNRYLLGLTGLAAAWTGFCVLLQLGIDHTPWDTTDSAGRPMGFNDRLSYEHYLIALSQARPTFTHWGGLLQFLYDLLLLAMIGLGGWLLVSTARSHGRRARAFFLLQGVVFPIGWLALPMAPGVWLDLLSQRLDRESFIDAPFDWLATQPVWVMLAFVIAVVLPGEPWRIREFIRNNTRRLWTEL